MQKLNLKMQVVAWTCLDRRTKKSPARSSTTMTLNFRKPSLEDILSLLTLQFQTLQFQNVFCLGQHLFLIS